MPSVVIAAHDEARVIGRCLRSVTGPDTPPDLEVVVVCNGCTDETAMVARGFTGVKVLELQERSKPRALNAGDDVVTSFPRMYLDADVELEPGALGATFDALSGGIEAVSPTPRFQLEASGLLVRMYYRAWMTTPFYNESLIGGSGAYALSEAGRARFDRFPELISDDGFVRLQFRSDERRRVRDAVARVRCPAKARDLVRMMTRVDVGIIELRRTRPELQRNEENGGGSALKGLLRHPGLLPCYLVYAFTRLLTRWRAGRLRAGTDDPGWGRDESSRTGR